MRKITVALVGFGAGAAAAALLDPSLGHSRRAALSQRGPAIARRVTRRFQRGVRSAEAEVEGVRQKLEHAQPDDMFPDDDRLLDRVRTELFRDPRMPKGELNINIEHGTVVLRGHVDDASTKQKIESRTRRIQGVSEVENLIHVG